MAFEVPVELFLSAFTLPLHRRLLLLHQIVQVCRLPGVLQQIGYRLLARRFLAARQRGQCLLERGRAGLPFRASVAPTRTLESATCRHFEERPGQSRQLFLGQFFD